ncbi:MAG: M15 family metallopeptidase, partial [Flavobacteriales bacterium]
SKENGRTGYHEEKWHWSYLPLSKIYLNYYNQQITYKDINDFEGAEFAKEIDIIKNYVNGISLELNK